MSTLSVPLNPSLEEFIDSFVRKGRAANKAEVVRQALRLLEEEDAVASVLRAEQEPNLLGDLRKLAKKIK